MNPIPTYDATAPIACTIGTDEIPGRIELVERMRINLRTSERTADGLLLRFVPTAANEADVRRFANDEKGCCQFWGFAVDVSDDEVRLQWDGPPDVGDLLDRLHRHLSGTEPISALAGLL